MLTIVEASGATLQTEMTIEEFQAAILAAAPSSWVQINEVSYGTIWVNTFTIAFYY